MEEGDEGSYVELEEEGKFGVLLGYVFVVG